MIDLEKQGLNYLEVPANAKIHILIKTWEENYPDGYYCYGKVDSNQTDPPNANNENDFEVE